MTFTMDIGNIAVAIAALAAIGFSFYQSQAAIKNQNSIENERLFREEREKVVSEISEFVTLTKAALHAYEQRNDYERRYERWGPTGRKDVLKKLDQINELYKELREQIDQKLDFIVLKYSPGTVEERNLADAITSLHAELPGSPHKTQNTLADPISKIGLVADALRNLLTSYQKKDQSNVS
jgi:hypothetical protein